MSEKEITLQEMSRLMNNVLKYEGKAIDAIRPEGINKKKAEIKAELARMDLKPEDKVGMQKSEVIAVMAGW